MKMPINLIKWIDENSHLLKPPVGNKIIYENSEYIIMIVGGPNARKDFHFNQGEEFFYQLEGSMKLPVIVSGEREVIDIKEGEIFLLPAGVPHSPQRYEDTIGLVIEHKRKSGELDSCIWFCECCNHPLHKETFQLDDIVSQLKELLEGFYKNKNLTTCSNCGTKMDKPTLNNVYTS